MLGNLLFVFLVALWAVLGPLVYLLARRYPRFFISELGFDAQAIGRFLLIGALLTITFLLVRC